MTDSTLPLSRACAQRWLPVLILALLAVTAQAQPQVLSLTPPIGAVDVSRSAPLEILFDRPVTAGPGSVVIWEEENVIAEIPPHNMIIEGAHVTIPLPQPLPFGAVCWVSLYECFLELQDTPNWEFTVEAFEILALEPAAGAVGVDVSSPLRCIFNCAVTAGPGTVEIRRTADHGLHESFAAAQLAITDSLVEINPTGHLAFGAGYYVMISADAFHDGAGGFFPGFNDPGTWSFSTRLQFTDLGAGLPGVIYSSVAWGDMDSDGDLDILLTGLELSGNRISRIYRNDGGAFSDLGAGLPGVYYCPAAWGDMDNDGDLDVLLAGQDNGGNRLCRIYRNDGGSFSDLGAGLPGVIGGSVAWGDMDNDGDLDILLAGEDAGNSRICRIYRNNGGSFSDADAGLPGLFNSAAWGDADSDGDLDLLLGGSYGCRIYRNDGGSFTDVGAGLPGIGQGSVAWGDMDCDGDLDVLLSGITDFSYRITRIYRNNGGSFSDLGAGLPGLSFSLVAWGDMDNDGDLDILLSGMNPSNQQITRIYRNNGGSFSDLGAGLPGVSSGSLACGDMDGDGDLDLLLTGQGTSSPLSRLYLNNTAAVNTPPQPPANLRLQTGAGDLTLLWDPAGDAETPAAGLSYNLRVGTPEVPDLCLTGMARSDGRRLLPALGNAQQDTSWSLHILSWFQSAPYPQESRLALAAVQAVDHGWAGGAWAEASIELNPDMEVLALRNASLMQADDLLSWDLRQIEDLAAFELQVALAPGFDPPLLEQWIPFANPPARRDLMIGVALADLDDFALLQPNQAYFWRLRPVYTDARRATVFSATPGSFTLIATPPAPQHLCVTVAGTEATLLWDAVPGVLMYYVVYTATDAYAPFPAGWQAQTPTFQTSWTDPQATTARRFYRVKAVVVE